MNDRKVIHKNNIGKGLSIFAVFFSGIAITVSLFSDVYHSSYNATIFGGIYASLCLASCAILQMEWDGKLRWTPLDFLMFIVFLYVLSRGLDTMVVLWRLAWISLPVVYLSIRLYGRYMDTTLFFALCLISLLVLSVHGYMQYFEILPSNNTYFTITGPYANPALYAGFMALLLTVVIARVLMDYSVVPSTGIILLGLIAIPIFLLADSRAALLACGGGIAYVVWYRFLRRLSISRLGVVICVPVLTVAAIYLAYIGYQKRTESVQGRLLIWKVSVQMIKERPLWGWGTDGFRTSYMLYQAQYLEAKGTSIERRLASNNHLTYNEPLRFAVDYGLIGLAFYLLAVYRVVRYRPRDPEAVVLKAGMLSYIVLGLFSYPTQNFPVLFWGSIVLAMVANRNPQRSFPLTVQKREQYIFKCIGFILLGLLTAQLISQHNVYRHLLRLLDGRLSLAPTERRVRMASLHEALVGHVGYLSSYAYLLFQEGRYVDCLRVTAEWEKHRPVNELYVLKGDCLQKLGYHGRAEETYLLADAMVPARQRARTRLALLYHRIGREEEGRVLAERILKEEVKVYGFETYELHEELKQIFNIHQINLKQ